MADALLGGLIINEILPQPVSSSGGYDTDGDGNVHANDEYVEFFNNSASDIDISGVQLWDPGWGNWFTFPPGSILPAGGYAIVVTNLQAGGALPAADLAFSAGRSALINNTGGDHIVVRDPSSDEYIVASYDNPPPLDTASIPGFPDNQTQVGSGEDFGAMVAGGSIQRIPNGGDTFVNSIAPTPGAVNLCFVSGTMIDTPIGPRAIEMLRVGDEITTANGRTVLIRWLGARRVTKGEADAQPAIWPITFAAGSLGANLPRTTLKLSPQHRILVNGPIAQRLFGTPEVLIAAKDFLHAPDVSQDAPDSDFWYFHIMCDEHNLVVANGVVAETLYLGPMAKRALPPPALDEIRAIFPDIFADDSPEPVRAIVKGKDARKLIQRIVQNGKPMQTILPV